MYDDKGSKSDSHFASLPLELLFDSQRAKLVDYRAKSLAQDEVPKQP